ncbi:MAG: hypothetical protein COB49_03470 [Alphaproteobacteria bacterium]|nr:MAG: hypothetical protein COB49_03470 [Alphaproteobacteria bacterium]
MKYEWDENKQVSNIKKHGVAFTDILSVFTDPCAVTAMDDRYDYGEERHNIIGAVRGFIFCVTFTYRNKNVRIISARLAHKKERTSYEQ